MKNKLRISLVIILFIVSFGLAEQGQAADKIQGTTFSKKVKHPDNQLDSGEALNLLMKPGQKQKVSVEITNYSDKEITVNSKVSGSRTNGHGGLEYGPTKLEKDKSMKYDLPDLVKSPEKIKVPAKGKADLVLEISMPETAYEGVVTGGVQLMQEGQGVETQDEKGAVVQNKFAFVFGVTLRNEEKEVKPNFDFRSVKAGQQNYRNAILVKLANVQPMIAKDMVLNVEVAEKGKKEISYRSKVTDISMAPNTMMEVPVSMDGDRMRAGEYTANIVLKGYGKEWKWKENFKITDEEADKFNKEDPYLVQERGLDWKTIALIVGGVVGLVVLIIVILKFTKKDTGKKAAKKGKRTKK